MRNGNKAKTGKLFSPAFDLEVPFFRRSTPVIPAIGMGM